LAASIGFLQVMQMDEGATLNGRRRPTVRAASSKATRSNFRCSVPSPEPSLVAISFA